LHFVQLGGRNSHHIIEAAFKAFARALAEAVAIDEKKADKIPSTKGVLV
jgi:imidazoleglycerol-phosphate dehydratase